MENKKDLGRRDEAHSKVFFMLQEIAIVYTV